MRFGENLENRKYRPWRSNYLEYGYLKKLLREDGSADSQDSSWTDNDESRFVDELVNNQLEKVNDFHNGTHNALRMRTSTCEERLKNLESKGNSDEKMSHSEVKTDEGFSGGKVLEEVLEELDSITKDINELFRYSRLNYAGFLKIAKKHDRRRGSRYKVRPLLQVRLVALPFNSEDYSPLLYRLSVLYSFARQRKNGETDRAMSMAGSSNGKDTYTSHKFWVHPENLLEVKTYILRRLPVLVFNAQTAKVAEGGQADPTITSLYFDNSKFEIYDQKLGRSSNASSLRLRWSGQLDEKPEIHFEKKVIRESGDSEVTRFAIKDKYVQPFIEGDYKMEKSVEKLRDRGGAEGNSVLSFQRSVEEVQSFIKEYKLQPVLRANYNRTAFQIPGDNRVRISIDTDIAFIREDAFNEDRPCRDPRDWHRRDVERLGVKYPFTEISQSEISRFPHALMELKVKDGSSKRTNEWISDLMSSHLLKEAPRFSKFIHGIAMLFEDQVNSFPFWLSDLETDIRKDPEDAFQEEQEKNAKKADDELAVGSFLGKSSSPFKAAIGSPAGKHATDFGKRKSASGIDDVAEEADTEDKAYDAAMGLPSMFSGLLSRTPFSNSKYARAHRYDSVQLPPGVREPGKLIKDMNPVQVEPKVWLANQRTFIKWQHISVLLASLSLALFNAAGENNTVARGLGVVYTVIALFAGAWGWWMYIVRSRMIEERSGRDFDNVIGPIVTCVGLIIALCLNFGFKYNAANSGSDYSGNPSSQPSVIDTLGTMNHQDLR